MNKMFNTKLKKSFCFFVALIFISESLANNIFVKDSEIEYGDVTILRWELTEPKAYVTNVGLVTESGSIELTPEKSMNYQIIGNSLLYNTNSVSIKVNGVKGINPFAIPHRSVFDNTHSNSIKVLSNSISIVLNEIHDILQNKLEFVVEEKFDRSNNKTSFITNLSSKKSYLNKEDTHLKSRRVGYLIDIKEILQIDKTNENLSFDIKVKTIFQYKRRNENIWENESDQNGYILHSKNLTKLLLAKFQE